MLMYLKWRKKSQVLRVHISKASVATSHRQNLQLIFLLASWMHSVNAFSAMLWRLEWWMLLVAHTHVFFLLFSINLITLISLSTYEFNNLYIFLKLYSCDKKYLMAKENHTDCSFIEALHTSVSINFKSHYKNMVIITYQKPVALIIAILLLLEIL